MSELNFPTAQLAPGMKPRATGRIRRSPSATAVASPQQALCRRCRASARRLPTPWRRRRGRSRPVAPPGGQPRVPPVFHWRYAPGRCRGDDDAGGQRPYGGSGDRRRQLVVDRATRVRASSRCAAAVDRVLDAQQLVHRSRALATAPEPQVSPPQAGPVLRRDHRGRGGGNRRRPAAPVPTPRCRQRDRERDGEARFLTTCSRMGDRRSDAARSAGARLDDDVEREGRRHRPGRPPSTTARSRAVPYAESPTAGPTRRAAAAWRRRQRPAERRSPSRRRARSVGASVVRAAVRHLVVVVRCVNGGAELGELVADVRGDGRGVGLVAQ